MHMQPVYDAIKQAQETGEAWVTFKEERLHLVRFEKNKHDWGDPYFMALVRSKRKGGVAFEELGAYKDVGSRVKSHYSRRRLGWDDILVLVTERHPREKIAS